MPDEKNVTSCKRSVCPISGTLDLIGDKWTLLVVRDLLFFGKRTYGQLQDSPEKIPTNLLADRLKRLEGAGVLRREVYQQKPTRYEYHLTERGEALRPMMVEMIHWGAAHVKGAHQPTQEEIDRL